MKLRQKHVFIDDDGLLYVRCYGGCWERLKKVDRCFKGIGKLTTDALESEYQRIMGEKNENTAQ